MGRLNQEAVPAGMAAQCQLEPGITFSKCIWRDVFYFSLVHSCKEMEFMLKYLAASCPACRGQHEAGIRLELICKVCEQ